MPSDTRSGQTRRAPRSRGGARRAVEPHRGPSASLALPLPILLLLLPLLSLVAPFWRQLASCDALRMINLDAPDVALQGDTIHLSCFFSLQNGAATSGVGSHSRRPPASSASPLPLRLLSHEPSPPPPSDDTRQQQQQRLAHADGGGGAAGEPEVLYAIKWYKDEREFFRFLSQDWPKKQALPTEGIQVDLDKSDNHTVVLRGVSLKTSGLFRCEVSTDAPYFVTKSMERRMSIYSLPNKGPSIAPAGSQQAPAAGPLQASAGPKSISYYLGEHVELYCSAPESKPAATLDWIVNDFLNLSAATLLANQVPLFHVKGQRFVRLPVADGSISGQQTLVGEATSGGGGGGSSSSSSGNSNRGGVASNQAVGAKNSTKQLTNTSGGLISAPPIAYAIYELHNETIAKPYQTKEDPTLAATRPPVSLAASLAQLPEVSTSRLNFTVDANLLQLLSLSQFDTQNGARVSRRQVSSGRELNVDGPSALRQPTGRLTIQASNSIQSSGINSSDGIEQSSADAAAGAPVKGILSKRSSATSQANQANPSMPIKRVSSDISMTANSRRQLPLPLNSYSLFGAKAKAAHRNNANDNHKLVLRIKCVARVLHLKMSDDIKIKLANRTRELKVVADDSAMTGAQRRPRPNIDKNSGCSGLLKLEWQSSLLFSLIYATTLFIYQLDFLCETFV